MNITDEMFLLTHRPDGRLVRLGMRDGVAYTMTAIVDLVAKERVMIDEGKQPHLHVVNTELTGDPVLDYTLTRLAAERNGDRLARCLIDKHADPKDEIINRLINQGVVESHSGGLMALGATSYPVRDPHERDRILARLAQAINGSAVVEAKDAALLTALDGLGISHKVLGEQTGLSRGELHKRIKHIAQEAPGSDAVRRVMVSLNAVVAATVGATAGAS